MIEENLDFSARLEANESLWTLRNFGVNCSQPADI